jgi:hypothetical protein
MLQVRIFNVELASHHRQNAQAKVCTEDLARPGFLRVQGWRANEAVWKCQMSESNRHYEM